MASSPYPYKRLGGQAARAESWLTPGATRVQLFLGADHLLVVEKTWFQENYRRFFFKDVQAFILRTTNSGYYTNIALAFASLLFFLFGIASSNPVRLALSIPLVACLMALLVSWRQGPSCRCYLKTAVQYEELAPLKRRRAALKTLARLRTEIERVQGRLPPVAPATPEFIRTAATPSAADETTPEI